MDVPALADIEVSIFLPGVNIVQSFHPVTRQTNYISIPGSFTDAIELPTPDCTPLWYLLTGIEVLAEPDTVAILVLGDSTTDGFGNPSNRVDACTPWPSWPNRLAERRQRETKSTSIAVLNAGISGNRILSHAALDVPATESGLIDYAVCGSSALTRFDRDVTRPAGVTCVFILLGINDIGKGPSKNQVVSAEALIAGQKTLIALARSKGFGVIGSTLTPFAGYPEPYYSEENDRKRQTLNEWIRRSNEYDLIVDFDAVLSDPLAPSQLIRVFDSGDHLHPSDAGYLAMANAADLPALSKVCLGR